MEHIRRKTKIKSDVDLKNGNKQIFLQKGKTRKSLKKNLTQSLLKFSFHQTIENKKTNVHLKAREKKVILLIITDGET